MTQPNWKISPDNPNWECDWKSSERFQLQYFKSLPIEEKYKAVEEMCRLAEYLKEQKAKKKEK